MAARRWCWSVGLVLLDSVVTAAQRRKEKDDTHKAVGVDRWRTKP